MANNNATNITNREATPMVKSPSRDMYGKVRTFVATIEVAAADVDDDTYTMLAIPAGARVQSVRLANDAITAGTDYDIGLYSITAGSLGAVKDADIYADGLDLSSARAVPTEVLFNGTGAKDMAEVLERVYEDAGDTDQLASEYYVVLTANTVGSAAGSITLFVDCCVE